MGDMNRAEVDAVDAYSAAHKCLQLCSSPDTKSAQAVGEVAQRLKPENSQAESTAFARLAAYIVK